MLNYCFSVFPVTAAHVASFSAAALQVSAYKSIFVIRHMLPVPPMASRLYSALKVYKFPSAEHNP